MMDYLLSYEEFLDEKTDSQWAAEKLKKMQAKDSAIASYQKSMGGKHYPENSEDNGKKRFRASLGMKMPSLPWSKRSYAKRMGKESKLSKQAEPDNGNQENEYDN